MNRDWWHGMVSNRFENDLIIFCDRLKWVLFPYFFGAHYLLCTCVFDLNLMSNRSPVLMQIFLLRIWPKYVGQCFQSPGSPFNFFIAFLHHSEYVRVHNRRANFSNPLYNLTKRNQVFIFRWKSIGIVCKWCDWFFFPRIV